MSGIETLSKNVEQLLQNSSSHETELKNLTKAQDDMKQFLYDFKKCVEKDIRHSVTRDVCESRIRAFDTKIGQLYKHSDIADEKIRLELDRCARDIKADVREARKTMLKAVAVSVSVAALAFTIFQFLYLSFS